MCLPASVPGISAGDFRGPSDRSSRGREWSGAKPAEPTPLIAARFIRLLHEAGVPPQVVHLVPTPGRLFGEIALAHPALAGVAMTGSTATALTINRAMARAAALLCR